MFKKFICLYFFISITYASYTQTFEDVLRYSSFYNEGTARFNSMGGAFGALGLNNSGPSLAYSSPTQIGGTKWSYLPSSPSAHIGGLAIKTDGTLWSWGDNTGSEAGILGLNDEVSRSSPTQVGTDTNWEYVLTAGYGEAQTINRWIENKKPYRYIQMSLINPF